MLVLILVRLRIGHFDFLSSLWIWPDILFNDLGTHKQVNYSTTVRTLSSNCPFFTIMLQIYFKVYLILLFKVFWCYFDLSHVLSPDSSAVKISSTTSYADHYTKKSKKFEKSVAAVHKDGKEVLNFCLTLYLSIYLISKYISTLYLSIYLVILLVIDLFGSLLSLSVTLNLSVELSYISSVHNISLSHVSCRHFEQSIHCFFTEILW